MQYIFHFVGSKRKMRLNELKAAQKQLLTFVDEFKTFLGRRERVHWCWMYLSGLLLNGERKSIQPLAERLPGGNEQALQQFVNQSPWVHEQVQLHLTEFLAKHLKVKRGILVLDDTSLPKKGHHSVGVSHQYCGALGKIANCQSLVTWHYVESKGEHFPVLGELYLPQAWTKERKRLKQAGVPSHRFAFKRKWELALELLTQIPLATLPYEAIVFDAGYGEIREFLQELDKRNQTFVAQIPESHGFWPLDVAVNTQQPKKGRPRRYEAIADKTHKALSAKHWRVKVLAEKHLWQKIKLPLNSKKVTQVIALRVREVIQQAYYRPGIERWLLIEKQGKDYKYYVSNASLATPVKQMVLWAHERWKVEQGYQQLKEELGLDHFEGRSWRGLHHHVTLCFMAYAFLVLLKNRGLKKTKS